MFKITNGKGFQITYPNGWTVSVQWGPGNYCENRNFDMWIPNADIEAGAKGSKTAEIAAWDRDGNWYKFPSDEVKGWVNPIEVLEFQNMIANLQSPVDYGLYEVLESGNRNQDDAARAEEFVRESIGELLGFIQEE